LGLPSYQLQTNLGCCLFKQADFLHDLGTSVSGFVMLSCLFENNVGFLDGINE
jgi:hypothetical protein